MTDAPHGPETSVDAPLRCLDVAVATSGQVLRASERPVAGAAVDSRKVEPGNAFVALPGERTDGHAFLADAAARGAAALLVTRALPDAELDALATSQPGGVSIIRVEGGLAALHALARSWRARFDLLVVGVTGSLAKTSTKEATAAVLSAAFRVLRTPGNENNEIGVPLSLLRLRRGDEAAVLEMGMYVPGDVATLAALARPRIGVVTAVRGVHLERAGSIEAIEAGKAELVEALPSDGTAVLNGDDPRVRNMAGRAAARVLTYGFGPGADVRATAVEARGIEGMRFGLRLPGEPERVVELPVPGAHSVHNGLAAAAVGSAAGMAADAIVSGLELGWQAPHRGELRHVGPWLVVDDTYNAGPDSMAAALDLLGTLPGRRVAVLGEMLELGPETPALHRGVGRHAAGRADLLVTIGHGAAQIAAGARAAGMPPSRTVEADGRADALGLLQRVLRPGDTVLFKASRGLGFDQRERAARGLGLDELIDDLERTVPGAAPDDPAAVPAGRGAAAGAAPAPLPNARSSERSGSGVRRRATP